MSTPNPFVADFDAGMVAAFAEAGLADSATYTAPGGEPVERTVIVETGQQQLGEYGQILGPRTVIGFLLADGAVAVGATVVVGPRTYTTQRIDETDRDDGSLQLWSVTGG